MNIRNEPWCSFHFEDREDSLGVVVVFKGEHLESVSLSINHPKFGSSWEEWSEKKELERKQANDQWLTDGGLIPGKNYSWGSVWSEYDPKSGSSMIVIRYSDNTANKR